MVAETAVDVADGMLVTRDGRQVLTFRRRLAFPVDRVWEALTEPSQLSAWYPFPVVDRDLRVGGTIRFDAGDGTTLDCAVTKFDPPHSFGFREVDDLLHLSLQPTDTGCLLTLAHTFDDRSMAARCAAGWQFCLDALAAVLEQRAVTDPPEARRIALREAYARRFEADGTLDQVADKQVVRFQRHLAHPVGRVWAALTEPAEMIGWLGDAEVELVTGGRYVVRWLNTDEQGNRAIYHGTITRLEPPHRLEVSGDIHGVLRWELQPEVGGTLLTFSSTLALPEEYRTKVLAGWHCHLDFLAGHLDGQSVDLVNLGNGHWARIHGHYLAQRA
jgi:uncharacterized protein YndB with AHSA1/START domain